MFPKSLLRGTCLAQRKSEKWPNSQKNDCVRGP